MHHKHTPPLVRIDKYIERDDVTELWQLWGYEGPGGLVSIGENHDPQIVAQRLQQAKGKPCEK